jgi:hypothetical protein
MRRRDVMLWGVAGILDVGIDGRPEPGRLRVDVRYYLDPETGQPHIHEHGVTEAEVEWVLARPGEDGPSSGGSRQATGQTSAGRYLRIIYVPDPDADGVFVVTAYPLTGKPLKAYRRRRRKRKR